MSLRTLTKAIQKVEIMYYGDSMEETINTFIKSTGLLYRVSADNIIIDPDNVTDHFLHINKRMDEKYSVSISQQESPCSFMGPDAEIHGGGL